MRARARFAWLAGALALLSYAPSAGADGDDAAALLLRGFELRRDHRNEEALAVYEQAFALSPSPAVRAQRALAEQALGHWQTAERDLDLALATDDPWVERERVSLEKARAFVREHLAWLTVDVDAEGADIQFDGEPLSRAAAARVVAGVGVLEVRAAGRVPEFRRVSLAPSEHVHQQITLAPVAPAPIPQVAPLPVTAIPVEATSPRQAEVLAPPAASNTRDRSTVPPLPIALGILGIAGVATGAYFGVRTVADRNDLRTQCPASCTPATTTAGNKDYSNAQTSAAVSTVGIGAGLALVAAGGALWLLGRHGSRSTSSALQVAPAIGAGMTGVVLGGSL
jgi:hypothetical protein